MPNASAILDRRPVQSANPTPDLPLVFVTIPDTIAGMACPGCGCSLSACVSGGCGHGCCCRSGYHAQSCDICFGTGYYYAQPDAKKTRCPEGADHPRPGPLAGAFSGVRTHQSEMGPWPCPTPSRSSTC